VLTHAGQLEGAGHDEDQLAFLREERDYRNVTLVELPRGDFAVTVLRNAMMATFFKLLWEQLAALQRRRSGGHRRQGGEGSALPPAARGRLGGAPGQGTEESAAAWPRRWTLWRYGAELFASDAVDEARGATGLGPRWSELKRRLAGRDDAMLGEAGLSCPKETPVPQHRQARRAQRAHGLHPGRDAAPAARLSREACGDTRRTRLGSAGHVLDPEVPALSVRDLGIVRDVIDHGASSRWC
jgi:hypothetical protein